MKNPFKIISDLRQKVIDLEFDIKNLKIDKIELGNKTSEVTARALIEKIMKGDIEWYDYNQLPHDEKVQYYNEAQVIINNPVFKNTINRLINEWGEWSLKQSQNFDDVRDVRMNVVGMTLLQEEFESINNPDEMNRPAKNPNSVI